MIPLMIDLQQALLGCMFVLTHFNIDDDLWTLML